MVKRIVTVGLMAAIGLGLSACASDRYGGGYGDYAYGYGAAYPGYGWYDGFYYPGNGFYVYDQYRRPYRWTETQQRYWQGRGGGGRANWQGFANSDYRQRVTAERQALRAGTITRDQFRAERQAAARDARQAFRASNPGAGRGPGGGRFGGGGHHGHR